MNKAIHEGRNVKRIREILDVKQEVLAADMGISQQRLSEIEKKEKLDEELMEQIAGILKVPVDAIKNFDEEAAINIIADTVNNHDQSASIIHNPTFNPIDKIVELYERMLKEKDDTIARLEKILSDK